MTQQFTASEVRDAITWKYGDKLTRISAMLHAFADRLESDEKVQPTGFVSAGSLLALQSCRNDEYNGTVNLWMRPNEAVRANVPLYTHPATSDAERLAEALRNIQYSMRQALIYGNDSRREIRLSVAICEEALAAHSAQAQPPAARAQDWTDTQCVAFMATGLRHTEYKKGKSPTVEEIRQGARAAMLAAQENPNG